MNHNIWLIGAGPMAIAYAKVLQAQQIDFITIGRGEKNAIAVKEKTGINAISGGLENYLVQKPKVPEFVIVAVGVEALGSTMLNLMQFGVKYILCEKPGGLTKAEIEEIAEASKKYSCKILLAYNRRFYASVIKAQEIINEDGGIVSMNFEFTEWSHVIAPLIKPEGVKEHLFLNNSTHVVDLAFYLGGKPKEMHCFTSGSLSWHPSSSVFAGAGITENNVLFSYQANWEAPGRWSVEVLTKKHRLYFRPMEKLQIQNIGSIEILPVEIDDSLDINFKPGIFKQTQAFLNRQYSGFITLEEQVEMIPFYYRIANYKD